jgi:hypothetical protein
VLPAEDHPAAADGAAATASAAPAATVEGLLTNYLLGSTLYDTLPLDRFRAFFPAKFRSVKALRQALRSPLPEAAGPLG